MKYAYIIRTVLVGVVVCAGWTHPARGQLSHFRDQAVWSLNELHIAGLADQIQIANNLPPLLVNISATAGPNKTLTIDQLSFAPYSHVVALNDGSQVTLNIQADAVRNSVLVAPRIPVVNIGDFPSIQLPNWKISLTSGSRSFTYTVTDRPIYFGELEPTQLPFQYLGISTGAIVPDPDSMATGFRFDILDIGAVFRVKTDKSFRAGDADEDGKVTFSDFLILSKHYARAGGWLEGDFDANGSVAFSDFLALSANFSAETAPSAATAVPEPSLGFGLTLLPLIVFRRLFVSRRADGIHRSPLTV